jgi:hypothetical protein
MIRRFSLRNKLLVGAMVLLLAILVVSMAFAQTATTERRGHPQTRPRPAVITSFFDD